MVGGANMTHLVSKIFPFSLFLLVVKNDMGLKLTLFKLSDLRKFFIEQLFSIEKSI
jgi:hypothetical protein